MTGGIRRLLIGATAYRRWADTGPSLQLNTEPSRWVDHLDQQFLYIAIVQGDQIANINLGLHSKI